MYVFCRFLSGDHHDSDLNFFFLSCFACGSMSIIVRFHHGGSFVKDWVIYYNGGQESVIEVEDDKWCYFEAFGLVKDLVKAFKYGDKFRMWWQIEEVGFRVVRVDEDAADRKEYATRKKM